LSKEEQSDLERAFVTRFIQNASINRDTFDRMRVRQAQLIEGRKYTWDFIFPLVRVAVEVQGGTWMAKGGHNTGGGIRRDAEKNNLAVAAGWQCFYFTADMIEDPRCFEPLLRVLAPALEFLAPPS